MNRLFIIQIEMIKTSFLVSFSARKTLRMGKVTTLISAIEVWSFKKIKAGGSPLTLTCRRNDFNISRLHNLSFLARPWSSYFGWRERKSAIIFFIAYQKRTYHVRLLGLLLEYVLYQITVRSKRRRGRGHFCTSQGV